MTPTRFELAHLTISQPRLYTNGWVNSGNSATSISRRSQELIVITSITESSDALTGVNFLTPNSLRPNTT
ncbi:hypothetical protein Cantr_08997 [Candida viswanathii]|uniref:Uncharacterized protein n=1 Tax=Candida viswanathii TaxID=5486 RepID=A0A367YAA6_9ASCO|nr:hypothetical protein Cantr_08997 [Candida viswanathii]